MSVEGQAPINSLQAGRAIAALAVVVHHADQAVAARGSSMPAWLSAVFEQGYLGVDFFFVLSGFIIYWTNAPRVDRPGWSTKYISSRLSRIYPPYLPIGIAMAAAYMLLPGFRGGAREWDWFASLTLLPWGNPALSVAWTLQYEIMFYALAWLMLATRKVLVGSLLWAVLIVIFQDAVRPLALINLEFLFGMAAAWAIMKQRGPASPLLLIGAACAIVAFFLIGDGRLRVLFGLGVAMALIPCVRGELGGRYTVPKSLVFLGAASYAIYLIHLPLIAVFSRLPFVLPWPLFLLAMIAASAAAGSLYYLLYEKPVLRFFRDRRAPATAASP